MSYYWGRLRSDRKSWLVGGLFFLFVNIDLLVQLKDHFQLTPFLATFLAGNSLGHYAQRLVFWLLPLYLFFGPAGWYANDRKLGYDEMTRVRQTRNQSVRYHFWFSFIIPFCFSLMTFSMNTLLAGLIFHNGHENPFGVTPSAWSAAGTPEIVWQLKHQLLTVILFSLVTAFIIGAYSLIILALSILVVNQGRIFFLSLVIWFLAITGDHSLLLVVQPFAEYSFGTLGLILGVLVTTVVLLVTVAYQIEVRRDAL